jgi:hypothetical protein
MAKRTKRVTARKAKAGKAAKKSTAAKKKAASRPVKAKRKLLKAKTGHKRSGAKKSALRRPSRTTPPVQTETTVVDVIEEPVPGVVVVTEFVETHATRPDASERADVDRTVGPQS